MAGLDTNLLVRWLVTDDPAQTARTRRLLRRARDTNASLFIPVTVVLELEWVLRSRYRMAKADVLDVLTLLLETRELELENEAAIEHAIDAYASHAAGFSGCLHAALCATAQASPLLTFDRSAARLPHVRLVGG